MIFIGFVLCVLIFINIKQCASYERQVTIEKRQEHGVVIINSTKYAVPYVIQRTLVKVDARNLTDFLLLSNNERNESFLTLVEEVIICVAFEFSILAFLLSNPINTWSEKTFTLIVYILGVLLLTEITSHLYSKFWVEDPVHHLAGYEFSTGIILYTKFIFWSAATAVLWLARRKARLERNKLL